MGKGKKSLRGLLFFDGFGLGSHEQGRRHREMDGERGCLGDRMGSDVIDMIGWRGPDVFI